MSILIDTNILARIADAGSSQSQIANDTITKLLRSGEILQIVPQNIYEFWVMATRPLKNNGLGMSAEQTRSRLDQLEQAIGLLLDPPDILS